MQRLIGGTSSHHELHQPGSSPLIELLHSPPMRCLALLALLLLQLCLLLAAAVQGGDGGGGGGAAAAAGALPSLAVCVAIKDQNVDVREWIAYHRALGTRPARNEL